jgi:DASS family divalent anion:Na+ symporter
MAGKKLPYNMWRLLVPIAIGITVYLLPKPETVDPKGWQLFGIFVGTISGIVLKPLPMPAVALIGMLACVLTNTLSLTDEAFKGFSATVVWLVVFVFLSREVLLRQNLVIELLIVLLHFWENTL